ncbi:MAG: hypothetical protein Q8T08_06445, partial [Ignavibacteria bacterium]|nr:hypothetical protein [Ignavibacteria bacterium]
LYTDLTTFPTMDGREDSHISLPIFSVLSLFGGIVGMKKRIRKGYFNIFAAKLQKNSPSVVIVVLYIKN